MSSALISLTNLCSFSNFVQHTSWPGLPRSANVFKACFQTLSITDVILLIGQARRFSTWRRNKRKTGLPLRSRVSILGIKNSGRLKSLRPLAVLNDKFEIRFKAWKERKITECLSNELKIRKSISFFLMKYRNEELIAFTRLIINVTDAFFYISLWLFSRTFCRYCAGWNEEP